MCILCHSLPGGSLTHAGLEQSRQYGHVFRDQLFLTHNPAKRRLFLDGLQAYTSDEERVKQTAQVVIQDSGDIQADFYY